MLELKINNIFFFSFSWKLKKYIFFAWWTLKCANTKLIIFPYRSLLTKFGYFFKTDQNWFDRNYCVLWNFIININIVWKFYLMNRIIHEKLRFYAKKIIFFPILGGGASAGCAPLWIRPWGVWLITKNRIAYEPFIMNISNSNITSFFRFVNERAIYRWYNLISTCTGACDWLSRRKCTCWWIIVCSNLAA